MRRILLLFVALITIVFSCGKKKILSEKESDSYKITKIHFEDFGIKRTLKGSKLSIPELYYPELIKVVDDYLVISETQSDTLFHILNKNTFKHIKRIGKVGVGPNEVNNTSGIYNSEDKNHFWTNSATTKTTSKFAIEGNNVYSVLEIKPKNEEMYLAGTLVPSSEKSYLSKRLNGNDKFVEFSFDGTIINRFHSWADMLTLENIPPNVISSLFQGKLATNRNRDYFALACLDVDIIEVLNKKTGQINSIRGPVHHLPDFEVDFSAGYAMCALDLNSVVYKYLDITIQKDKIYALFSGHTFNEIDVMKEPKMCEQIFVFHMDGTPLAHYTLDQSIWHFTVDQENNRILGITYDEDPGLIVYELN